MSDSLKDTRLMLGFSMDEAAEACDIPLLKYAAIEAHRINNASEEIVKEILHAKYYSRKLYKAVASDQEHE